MWAGSNFEYNSTKCTFTETFIENEKIERRIDTALSWFSHPKTPANLVMLYIEQPDEYSHAYGHESPVVSVFAYFYVSSVFFKGDQLLNLTQSSFFRSQ